MFGYPNADLSHWLPHRQGKGRQNLQSPDDDGGKGLLVVEGPQFSLHQKLFFKRFFSRPALQSKETHAPYLVDEGAAAVECNSFLRKMVFYVVVDLTISRLMNSFGSLLMVVQLCQLRSVVGHPTGIKGSNKNVILSCLFSEIVYCILHEHCVLLLFLEWTKQAVGFQIQT